MSIPVEHAQNSQLVPHNSMSHLVTVTVTPPPRVSSSGGHSPRVPRTHRHPGPPRVSTGCVNQERSREPAPPGSAWAALIGAN